MNQLHRLLQRQLRKYLPQYNPDTAGMGAFIAAVSESYQHFESNQAFTERAMRLSSDELSETNIRLREETERMKAILESLKEAIRQVSHDQKVVSDADLYRITDILSEEIEKRKKLEADLRMAQHAAEDALEIRKQFLANVSHEIRTPINAIVGMSALLNESDLSAAQREHAEAIVASAGGLMEIIDQLLDMSKLESGKMELELVHFSIPALVSSIQRSLWLRAEEKGIELVVTIGDTVRTWAFGDVTRIRQVLLNLLSNSLKFTHEGQVSLKVEAADTTPDAQALVFNVSDTGVGIARDQLGSIFEKFTQADNTVSRKYGGTGLGLSISKQLAELMGGTLSVESHLGEGTTFTLRLHLGAGDEAMGARPVNIDYDFKGASVLVVEDNEINRYLALTLMRRANCRVDSAANGLVAVEKLKVKKYDLVLMDLQMPELDGIGATIRIKEELGLNVPLIALTASSNEKERDYCLQLGMIGYVSKPYAPAKLFETISQVFASTAVTPALREVPQYNLDKLHQLYQGNMQHIAKTVQVFIRQAETDIRQMQECLDSRQYPELKQLAHRIKPSIELFSIAALADVVGAIEEAADRRDMAELVVLLDGLFEGITAVTRSLKHEINTMARRV
jgi:signal transduction histidine kinase/CheY-like chemotaxis protein